VKITKLQLKRIIKEELKNVLNEEAGHLTRHLAKNPSLANPKGQREKRMQGRVVSGTTYSDPARDEPWLYDNDFENMDRKTLVEYYRKIEKLNDQVAKRHRKLTSNVDEKWKTLKDTRGRFDPGGRISAWVKESERKLSSLAQKNANYLWRLEQLRSQAKVMTQAKVTKQ
jgi:hypothetical protein